MSLEPAVLISSSTDDSLIHSDWWDAAEDAVSAGRAPYPEALSQMLDSFEPEAGPAVPALWADAIFAWAETLPGWAVPQSGGRVSHALAGRNIVVGEIQIQTSVGLLDIDVEPHHLVLYNGAVYLGRLPRAGSRLDFENHSLDLRPGLDTTQDGSFLPRDQRAISQAFREARNQALGRSRPTGIIIIPREGDDTGLLRPSQWGGSLPPMASRALTTSDRRWSPCKNASDSVRAVRGDKRADGLFGLLLAWRCEVVFEGVDRAARVHPSNLTADFYLSRTGTHSSDFLADWSWSRLVDYARDLATVGRLVWVDDEGREVPGPEHDHPDLYPGTSGCLPRAA